MLLWPRHSSMGQRPTTLRAVLRASWCQWKLVLRQLCDRCQLVKSWSWLLLALDRVQRCEEAASLGPKSKSERRLPPHCALASPLSAGTGRAASGACARSPTWTGTTDSTGPGKKPDAGAARAPSREVSRGPCETCAPPRPIATPCTRHPPVRSQLDHDATQAALRD